ncbi:hypothetical protein HCR16_05425 [Wolbachia pipientis]|uniref:hypothetical protein n=1 Tax=Wolbachia pipientis TaxID=955 RepID=UPI0015F8DAB8|nr:hypothetical protein [Wolbachia pipientis]MBA8770514.1 hypothetical protein [Wolbachia pipientis]
MPASLKFESAAGTAAATLAEVKLVTLADNTGNKYTLDITTNDLKVAYTKNGGSKTEYTVNGLATALGKLLTIDGSTPGKSVLAEEAAKKPVVDALIPELAKGADDQGIYTKKGVDDALKLKADTAALADKVNVIGDNATDPGVTAMLGKLINANKVLKVDGSNATDPGVNAMLGKLIDANKVLKVDGSNATDPGVNAMLGNLTDKVIKISELPAKAAEKAVIDAITASPDFTNKVYIKAAPADEVYTKTAAETAFVKATELKTKAAAKDVVDAIFDAKDGDKSILVDKLGGFLAENTKAYDNGKKTAKELLVPSAADLAQDHDFKQGIDKSIKEMAVSSNSDFQKNVREVMSQSYFEPSASDDAALNLIW